MPLELFGVFVKYPLTILWFILEQIYDALASLQLLYQSNPTSSLAPLPCPAIPKFQSQPKMLPESLKLSTSKIVISTGNILPVNKKTGQKPTEELFDCLHVTVNDPVVNDEAGEVFRSSDDLQEKISEHERNSIKIGAKVFLNHNSVEYLEEAVSSLLRILNVDNLDNLILAYHPKGGVVSNRTEVNNLNNEQKEGVLEWGGKSDQAVKELKQLWSHLEHCAKKKMICQLGISDLDVDTLSELYSSSDVHPVITQINLSACCVVPPALQEFCNHNDIQLLTHSDPEVIVTEDTLSKLGLSAFIPTWTVRYQVHVKCRGLLTAKGYILGAQRKDSAGLLNNVIREL